MNAYGFMPHGYCFLWRASVLWLHISSDAAIATSYYCIPIVLIYFIRKRRDLPFPLIFWMFSAFILLCGTTHAMSIWVLWHPDYYIEGWIKAATAIVSAATLGRLIIDVPTALELVSPALLAEQNVKLTAMVEQTEERGRITLSAIVDNVSDGIVTVGDDGRIRSFNAACSRLFGYEASEILGRDINCLLGGTPRHTQQGQSWQQLVNAGAQMADVRQRDTVGLRKDGTVFPLELVLSSFLVDGSRYFTACLRDVTRQKQAAAEREMLLARLTRSNAELERFAYVASHDMQEPVRMMLSFSELLKEDYGASLNEDGKEYLSIISSSALRMKHMIRDLLDYARMEGEEPSISEVDMKREMLAVITNLQQLINESGAVITFDEMPIIHGMPVQIMRLLQNLVINSIKYRRPSQVPVVHLGVTYQNGRPVFCLRDNGLGINPNFVEDIFQPFRRLHTWDSIPGSGLGLSVCRKIVENHGGRIWASSNAEAGTSMFFTLS